jgi:hypothetical protein
VQLAFHIRPQQPHLPGVLEQQLARGGGAQRPGAHDQHRTHLRFQRPQPLRHGRLRDGQPLGGAVEAALLHDGGQAFQSGRVEDVH